MWSVSWSVPPFLYRNWSFYYTHLSIRTFICKCQVTLPTSLHSRHVLRHLRVFININRPPLFHHELEWEVPPHPKIVRNVHLPCRTCFRVPVTPPYSTSPLVRIERNGLIFYTPLTIFTLTSPPCPICKVSGDLRSDSSHLKWNTSCTFR